MSLKGTATDRLAPKGAKPAARAGIGGQIGRLGDRGLPRERRGHDAQTGLAQGHCCRGGRELPADLRIESHARHEADLDQPLVRGIKLPVTGGACTERRADLGDSCPDVFQITVR